MKKIIILCTLLALLIPLDVASGESIRFDLEREWRIRQAEQQRQAAHFRAIEADAARAIGALKSEWQGAVDKPMYRSEPN
jgi:hypothetical protein